MKTTSNEFLSADRRNYEKPAVQVYDMETSDAMMAASDTYTTIDSFEYDDELS